MAHILLSFSWSVVAPSSASIVFIRHTHDDDISLSLSAIQVLKKLLLLGQYFFLFTDAILQFSVIFVDEAVGKQLLP